MKRSSLVLIALSVFIAGCIHPDPSEVAFAGNSNPVIDRIITDPVYITVGTTAKISVVASDPDGDELNYEWNCVLGDIIGEGEEVFYTAAFCCVGSNRVNVKVKDSRGGSTAGFIDIIVNP